MGIQFYISFSIFIVVVKKVKKVKKVVSIEQKGLIIWQIKVI